MNQRRIYVTRRVPPIVEAALAETFTLRYHDSETPPTRDELLAGAAGMDGLLTTLSDRVDDELLAVSGHQLKVIANYAVGFDNIDLAAATRQKVLVTNTPDVLTKATAEFTIALMLSLLRRVSEGDRFLRKRQPWIWAPTFMLGSGLHDRLLGIVGFGRIGREVARLANAFGARVIYSDAQPVQDAEYEQVELRKLLSRSDVVSLHCPLSPETHHLIGAKELARMRSDAYLVNTARGPIIDEAALAAALRTGAIAGAALDVFEHEPAVTAKLLELENVVLAPHLASATEDTRAAMGMLCAAALSDVLYQRRAPANALNSQEVRIQG